MKTKTKIATVVLTTVLILSAIFLIFESEVNWLLEIFSDPKRLRDFVAQYEPYGFFVLFGLQIMQVILAPLPGQVVGAAFGSVYGPILGFVLGWIGNVIATVFVIYIAKKFGRPAVKWMVGEDSMKKYEEFVGSKDVYPFIVLVFLPGASDDVVCYVAGLTDISSLRLITAISIARAPGIFVLSVFGDSLVQSDWKMVIGILVFVIIFATVVIWKYGEITDYLSDKYGNGSDRDETEEE